MGHLIWIQAPHLYFFLLRVCSFRNLSHLLEFQLQQAWLLSAERLHQKKIGHVALASAPAFVPTAIDSTYREKSSVGNQDRIFWIGQQTIQMKRNLLYQNIVGSFGGQRILFWPFVILKFWLWSVRHVWAFILVAADLIFKLLSGSNRLALRCHFCT